MISVEDFLSRDALISRLGEMSKGNPGAISVLIQIVNHADNICPMDDPDDVPPYIKILISMDVLEIYGSKIWLLFKDICGQDLPMMVALLMSMSYDISVLPSSIILDALEGKLQINLDKVKSAILEKLPKFNFNYGKEPIVTTESKQYPEYTNAELATIFGISKRQASDRRSGRGKDGPLGPLPDGCIPPTQEAARKEHLAKISTGFDKNKHKKVAA